MKKNIKSKRQRKEASKRAAATAESSNETRAQESKSKTLCRDFMKGKCPRAGNCKFSHKYDISQLVGIHKFCRNYQDSICTRTNCKYIHATVLEEERFLQTGELPQRALVKHKGGRNVPAPPSPPRDVDRSLRNLDEEEEHLRKRIEAIEEKLEKINRARIRNRHEKDALEKRREKLLQPPAEPRRDQQKLLLDQLNDAIKAQMAENRADSTMPNEMSTQPREIQKMMLDKLNKDIKNNLMAEQAQRINADGSYNTISMSKLLATFLGPRNTEEAPGSENSEQTLDEAAGGAYSDETDSTN